jgi:hypothetical protein
MVLVTDVKNYRKRRVKKFNPTTGKMEATDQLEPTQGYYMQGYLADNLSHIPWYLEQSWDVVGIVSGHCLDLNSSIQLFNEGKIINKQLKDIKDGEKLKTISWDFNNNKQVVSDSIFCRTREKELYEVELEDGRKIRCSKDHKLFIKRGNEIIEILLKDLKEGDELVCK